jgi:hypothetical protein
VFLVPGRRRVDRNINQGGTNMQKVGARLIIPFKKPDINQSFEDRYPYIPPGLIFRVELENQLQNYIDAKEAMKNLTTLGLEESLIVAHLAMFSLAQVPASDRKLIKAYIDDFEDRKRKVALLLPELEWFGERCSQLRMKLERTALIDTVKRLLQAPPLYGLDKLPNLTGGAAHRNYGILVLLWWHIKSKSGQDRWEDLAFLADAALLTRHPAGATKGASRDDKRMTGDGVSKTIKRHACKSPVFAPLLTKQK